MPAGGTIPSAETSFKTPRERIRRNTSAASLGSERVAVPDHTTGVCEKRQAEPKKENTQTKQADPNLAETHEDKTPPPAPAASASDDKAGAEHTGANMAAGGPEENAGSTEAAGSKAKDMPMATSHQPKRLAAAKTHAARKRDKTSDNGNRSLVKKEEVKTPGGIKCQDATPGSVGRWRLP